VQRLLAQGCELCGATVAIAVHHVRKLADLHRPGGGRPLWVRRMAARHRKNPGRLPTLHEAIHREWAHGVGSRNRSWRSCLRSKDSRAVRRGAVGKYPQRQLRRRPTLRWPGWAGGFREPTPRRRERRLVSYPKFLDHNGAAAHATGPAEAQLFGGGGMLVFDPTLRKTHHRRRRWLLQVGNSTRRGGDAAAEPPRHSGSYYDMERYLALLRGSDRHGRRRRQDPLLRQTEADMLAHYPATRARRLERQLWLADRTLSTPRGLAQYVHEDSGRR